MEVFLNKSFNQISLNFINLFNLKEFRLKKAKNIPHTLYVIKMHLKVLCV